MRLFSNHSLLGNSLSIFAIRFVTILANLFGIVYYSRNIATSQYGNYGFLLTSLAIFIALGSIGTGATVFNFSDSGIKKFYASLTLKTKLQYVAFVILVSVIFVSVLYFNGFPLFHYSDFLIMGSMMLFAVLCFVLDNVLLLFNLNRYQLFLNAGFSGLVIYAHIQALGTDGKLDFMQLCGVWALAYALKLLIQVFLFRRELRQKDNPLMDLSEIQPSKKTWYQMGFYEVFQAVVKQSDKFIVGIFTGKEAMAIYFNGRIDIPFLPAILSSVRNAALINLSKSKIDTEQILKVIHKTFLILSAVCFAVTAFGIVYAEEILTVVFTDKYLSAREIFVWGLLILPAQYCISLTYVLQYKEQANIINRGAFLDLIITIILLYPMYQWLGLSGIAVSVVISTYVQSIYYWIHCSKVLKVQLMTLIPFKSYVVKAAIAIGMACLSHYFFQWIFAPTFVLLFGTLVGLLCLWILLKMDTQKEIGNLN